MFAPTFMVDARLRLLPSCPRELVQRARVRLHIGTAEVLGRVVLLDREVLQPGERADGTAAAGIPGSGRLGGPLRDPALLPPP